MHQLSKYSSRPDLPGLRMVLVCGPRIDPATLDVPEGTERHGMVPDLYKHLAVCDLAVVQGGGATTLEVTALRRPFLFFPIEGQSEQEVTIASRLARQRAGVRMTQGITTPSSLADAIVANVGHEVTYAQIRADGARRAAKIILERASAVSAPLRIEAHDPVRTAPGSDTLGHK